MYICVCNAVSDRAIKAAIDAGATSFESLMDELGVATACGSCESAVRAELRGRLEALGLFDFLTADAA